MAKLTKNRKDSLSKFDKDTLILSIDLRIQYQTKWFYIVTFIYVDWIKLKKVKTFIWEEKIHRLRSIKKNDRIYSSQNVNK